MVSVRDQCHSQSGSLKNCTHDVVHFVFATICSERAHKLFAEQNMCFITSWPQNIRELPCMESSIRMSPACAPVVCVQDVMSFTKSPSEDVRMILCRQSCIRTCNCTHCVRWGVPKVDDVFD